MEYSYSTHGKRFKVEVSGDKEKGFVVSVDGKAFKVAPFSLSDDRLILDIDGRRKTFHMAESKDQVYVFFEGRQFTVQRTDGTEDFKDMGPDLGSGEAFVVTPMPGKIVKILVAENDPVEPNQPVFVIESMKMENEVRSLGRGRVKKVLVSPGDSLNHGDAVVELEPADPGETEESKEGEAK